MRGAQATMEIARASSKGKSVGATASTHDGREGRGFSCQQITRGLAYAKPNGKSIKAGRCGRRRGRNRQIRTFVIALQLRISESKC